MIENNPSNVSSGFEMLLEEVEAKVNFLKDVDHEPPPWDGVEDGSGSRRDSFTRAPCHGAARGAKTEVRPADKGGPPPSRERTRTTGFFRPAHRTKVRSGYPTAITA